MTAAKVSGSVALTPNSIVAINRVSPSDAASPKATPRRVQYLHGLDGGSTPCGAVKRPIRKACHRAGRMLAKSLSRGTQDAA